jgi:hypothetical protein
MHFSMKSSGMQGHSLHAAISSFDRPAFEVKGATSAVFHCVVFAAQS